MTTSASRLMSASLKRVVTLAILVTVLALAWVSWAMFQVYRVASVEIPRAIKMEELRGKVYWMDDIKSLTARMAAATGDRAWEQRYTEIEKELDEGLDDGKRFQKENPGGPDLEKYAPADAILDATEAQAFKLVNEGRLKEAQALLEGGEYEKHVKIYSDGLEEFGRWLRHSSSTDVEHMQQQAWWSIVVAAAVTLILMLCWGYILVAMRHWQATLVKTNRQLLAQSQQLEETNRALGEKSQQLEETNRSLGEKSRQLEETNQSLGEKSRQLEALSQQLDKKVAERTNRLKESEIALLNMMSDTVRGRENVQRALDDLQCEVAERKKVEAQLAQSQKMDAIGQLAGGVAHDFNNQLSVIMSYAVMLGDRLTDPKLKRYADNILTSSQRSADLTNKLLAFSRKGQFQEVPLSVHTLIAETVEMLERSIDKRIEIKQALRAESDIVVGDPSQLQNAFLNLAVNARDAMPEGGKLSFDTEVVFLDAAAAAKHIGETIPGRYVRICMSDTGTGMTDEVKRHLFEPFFTTKPVGKGTGMGLASVFGTVKNHKGVIDVYSEVGHGTTFKLYLPSAEPKSAPEIRAAKIRTKTKSLRVFLVEDEEILREMFAEMLKSGGHEIVVAENGRQALELYRRNWKSIDVVILDMIMPEINGPDTFRAMKLINPHVKALLSTGFSLNKEVQAALDDGVLGFIQKPFMPNDLLDLVAKVMNANA